MTSVFLGIKRRKFNKKDVHKYTSLLRFRRFNISLASCSAAELVSVSVEQCKIQIFELYLQTVKKVYHVHDDLRNRGVVELVPSSEANREVKSQKSTVNSQRSTANRQKPTLHHLHPLFFLH